MNINEILIATEPFALCKSCCEDFRRESVRKIRRTPSRVRLPCRECDRLGWTYYYVGISSKGGAK